MSNAVARVGGAPSVYDGAAFGQYLFSIKNAAFTRILLDQGIYVTMIVFAAGFRHLIRQAREDYEWVATLVFGSALVCANSSTGGTCVRDRRRR